MGFFSEIKSGSTDRISVSIYFYGNKKIDFYIRTNRH